GVSWKGECAIAISPRVAPGGVVLALAAGHVDQAVGIRGFHPGLPVARAGPDGDLAVVAKVDGADAGAIEPEVLGDRGLEEELRLVEEHQFTRQPVAIAKAHGRGGSPGGGLGLAPEEDAGEAADGEVHGPLTFHGLPPQRLVVARADQRAAEFVAIAEDERVAALGERLVAGAEAVGKL